MAEIKYLDLNGLKALYGVVDSKIQAETNRAETAEGALSAKIEAMDLTDTAKTGQFITAVHQTDGKVTIERGGVSASMVTATNVVGDDTVAITGATVEEQIKSLGQTLKTVEGNAAKYEVEKVTTDLPANVRTRYQVVSYVGTKTDTNKTKVGEFIDIPKDGQLIDVKPTENGQGIIFTYSTGDGGENQTITIDLGKAIFESEIGSGLQVNESVVSVKLAEGNESFLTVGTDGVKLAGVQSAIDAAVAAKNVTAQGDAYINTSVTGNKVSVSADVQPLTVTSIEGVDSTITGTALSLVDGAEVANKVSNFTNARISEEIAKLDATVGEAAVAGGKHVAVQVVEADGVVTAVNVNESDIASAATLATVKTAQEKNTDLLTDIPTDRKVKGYVDDAVDAARAAATTKVVKGGEGTHVTVTAGAPASDGSVTYTIGESDIASAATLASVKTAQEANTAAISGAINEDAQSISLGNKGLQFVALTEKDIRDAANSVAGN